MEGDKQDGTASSDGDGLDEFGDPSQDEILTDDDSQKPKKSKRSVGESSMDTEDDPFI